MSEHARYLVTGASGFVGRQLCRRLLDDGHAVVGAVRSAIEFPEFLGRSFATIHLGDVEGTTNWDEALIDVDIVFHLAADSGVGGGYSDFERLERLRRINVAGTRALAHAAVAHKVGRFVYLSTIKVNGEKTSKGDCFSETSIPAPVTPYGISKWEAEQEVWKALAGSDTDGVVLRPPLVYGAGVKGNFLQLLRLVGRGLPVPFAGIKNNRSLIYIENLLDALVICADHPLAAGNTYLLSDGESVSTGDLIRLLAEELGEPARLFFCPESLMQWAARLIGKTEQVDRLLGSLLVDGNKIVRELNWVMPYTLQQGLSATTAWYKTAHLANKR
jgi:nucleoside-diphosphate-sugar epimerase